MMSVPFPAASGRISRTGGLNPPGVESLKPIRLRCRAVRLQGGLAGLLGLKHPPQCQLVALKCAAHAGLESGIVQPLIAYGAHAPCFLGSVAVPRIPMVVLGARQPAGFIAYAHALAAWAKAAALGVQDFHMDLLHPPGKRSPLHREGVSQVFHLLADVNLP